MRVVEGGTVGLVGGPIGLVGGTIWGYGNIDGSFIKTIVLGGVNISTTVVIVSLVNSIHRYVHTARHVRGLTFF